MKKRKLDKNKFLMKIEEKQKITFDKNIRK
jgi:hypothetical protein